MGLFATWKTRRSLAHFRDLADQLADKHWFGVWQQTHNRALGMGLPEARGYVGAYAGATAGKVVCDLLSRRVDLNGARSEKTRQHILRETRRAMVQRSMSELLRLRRLSRPLRRAA